MGFPFLRMARLSGRLLFWMGVLTCSAQAATTSGNSVAIRLSFDPPTLDWNMGDVPIHVMNNVVEGLYRVDANGNVQPDEATSLPKRLAAGIYRITLRENLRWSDGLPVTANDYVSSWHRLRDPKTASTYAHLLSQIAETKVLNTQEIEIRLKVKHQKLRAAVFTHWATFPVRADVIKKHGSRWAKPEHMVFNGPYKITEYLPDNRLILIPNLHHRSPGKHSKVEALIVHDENTALRLFESGRLDFLPDLGQLDRAPLVKRKEYRRIQAPVLVYIGVDPNHPALASPKIRKTLSKAIDREAMIKVLGTQHEPAYSLVPGKPAHAPKSEFTEKLLKDVKLEFGYFEKGTNRTLVEFVQNQWKTKLGLEAKLDPSEVKNYWSRLAVKPYPIFLNSFGPPVWDRRYYLELLCSGNPMNMGRWLHKGYDQALNRGNERKAHAIFESEAPIIPLYFRAYEYLISPKLKNATINPMTSLYLE